MVRAPCCEKMGLKKGPWTPEEDQFLINYIQLHGHGNWRALPKQAGLLRCGKSCRLRWINYLRPDIKRGNFTREEEDAIIDLHQLLGNKWSAIAAKLPGRTDNEIKNVWHTHLKKRLKQNHGGFNDSNRQHPIDSSKDIKEEEEAIYSPVSARQSSSEVSTATTTSENNSNNTFTVNTETNHYMSEIDDNFWSEVLSADNSGDFVSSSDPPTSYFPSLNEYGSDVYDTVTDGNMDFWYNFFTRAEDLPQVPEVPEF